MKAFVIIKQIKRVSTIHIAYSKSGEGLKWAKSIKNDTKYLEGVYYLKKVYWLKPKNVLLYI